MTDHRQAPPAQARADETPVQGPLDYADYLRLGEVLSLQRPLSSPEHPDEFHFIVTHQSIELWFALLARELRTARAALTAGAWTGAAAVMRKAVTVVAAVRAQMETLRRMPAASFLAFRPFLGTASGLQSAQFRVLEVLSGLRDDKHLALLRGPGGRLPAGVAEELEQPSLAEVHQDAFTRAGVGDWARLYSGQDGTDEMRALCEALVEYDEAWVQWRMEHVLLVQRMMGGTVRGTAGTTSEYLSRTLGHRFFPYLWEARSEMALFADGYPTAGSHAR